jgi:hypothetical protein
MAAVHWQRQAEQRSCLKADTAGAAGRSPRSLDPAVHAPALPELAHAQRGVEQELQGQGRGPVTIALMSDANCPTQPKEPYN